MWFRGLRVIFFLSVNLGGMVSGEEPAPVMHSSEMSIVEGPAVADIEDSKEIDPFQERFQRMMITLFGLVAFMILGAIAVKQLMRARIGQVNQESAIQLLETRAISHKVSLHLVEIDGQRILVGETASHLSLLALPTTQLR